MVVIVAASVEHREQPLLFLVAWFSLFDLFHVIRLVEFD